MGLGILVALAGYTLVYLGLQNLNGCNAKLLDVITPGKYTPCTPASSPNGAPAPASAKSPNPGGPGGILGQGTGPYVPPGVAPQLGGHS